MPIIRVQNKDADAPVAQPELLQVKPLSEECMSWVVDAQDPWQYALPIASCVTTEESTAVLNSGSLPQQDDYLILSWEHWQKHPDAYKSMRHVGICFPNDGALELLAPNLSRFSLICLPFPVFQDGRSYSLATELRQYYQYPGELRATGDILPDQLHFIWRCGFDSLEIADDPSAEKRVQEMTQQSMPFSAVYQNSMRGGLPIYKKR